ncbi:hypothetical protein [Nostoc sp.]|uniref:hypothetical protein n=1 Tax=Nostoc sp. TaxID=1180 RepID=UPI003FA524FB
MCNIPSSHLNRIVSRNNRIVSRNNRIVSQNNRIVSQNNRIVSRNNRIVSQNNRIVSQNNAIATPKDLCVSCSTYKEEIKGTSAVFFVGASLSLWELPCIHKSEIVLLTWFSRQFYPTLTLPVCIGEGTGNLISPLYKGGLRGVIRLVCTP